MHPAQIVLLTENELKKVTGSRKEIRHVTKPDTEFRFLRANCASGFCRLWLVKLCFVFCIWKTGTEMVYFLRDRSEILPGDLAFGQAWLANNLEQTLHKCREGDQSGKTRMAESYFCIVHCCVHKGSKPL